jgi:hypothetical protein
MNLTPDQLADLGEHLQARLSDNECDHTLRFTQEWLEAYNRGKTKIVMEALRNQGGYCDCEVLNNVIAE